MEISLKNIQVNEGMSLGGTCFKASIYIDGIRAGEASNRGNGGVTEYAGFDPRGWCLVMEAEEHCKGLPAVPLEGDQGDEAVPSEMSLARFLDAIVADHLRKKEVSQLKRKLGKAVKENLVVGIPEGKYRVWSIKTPIEKYISSDGGRAAFRKFINEKVLPDLKEGEVILNSNLTHEFVVFAGIDSEKIVPQDDMSVTKIEEMPKQSESGRGRKGAK